MEEMFGKQNDVAGGT